MSEEVELKPCAYCGNAPIAIAIPSFIRESETFYRIGCETGDLCAFRPSRDFSSEAEAIKAWNTRPGEEAAYEAGRAAGKQEERERVVVEAEAELATASEAYSDVDPDRLSSWKSGIRFVIAIVRDE